MNVKEYINIRGLSEFTEPALSLLMSDVRCRIESVPILFNMRAIRRNGEYHHPSYKSGPNGRIKLHKHLSIEDANATFLHELAHAIEKISLGTHGHGVRWQMIMISMRQQPSRLNNRESQVNFSASVPYKWFYICRDCGYEWKHYRRLSRPYTRIHTRCKYKANGGHLEERSAA